MNATLSTIKQEYDLTTESGLIRLAQDAGRDFKFKMMLVVEYWCKPVQEGGQGKKIEDLAAKINKSAKTLRNHYVAPLRKEGRLPASTMSRTEPRKLRPESGAIVENSSTQVQPTALTTTTLSQSRCNELQSRPVEVEVLAPQPAVREPKFKTDEARAAWHHKQALIEEIHRLDQQFGSDWDEWHWLSDKHELHTLYTRAAQKSQAINGRIEQRVRDSFR